MADVFSSQSGKYIFKSPSASLEVDINGNLIVTGNVIVEGDLDVIGGGGSKDQTSLTVADSIIIANFGENDVSLPVDEARGFVVDRGSFSIITITDPAAPPATMVVVERYIWDGTSWQITNDGTGEPVWRDDPTYSHHGQTLTDAELITPPAPTPVAPIIPRSLVWIESSNTWDLAWVYPTRKDLDGILLTPLTQDFVNMRGIATPTDLIADAIPNVGYVLAKDQILQDQFDNLSLGAVLPGGNLNDILYWDGATEWVANPLSIVNDSVPQLGGDLDLNSFKIITAPGSGQDIEIEPDTGLVSIGLAGASVLSTDPGESLSISPSTDLFLKGLKWPNADGTAGQVIGTDGAGTLSFSDTVHMSALIDDLSPQLGADLDVNGFDIRNNFGGGGQPVKISGLGYPIGDGTAGQVLSTDGAGTISFLSVPSFLDPFRSDVTYTVDADGGTPGTYDFDSVTEAIAFVMSRNITTGTTPHIDGGERTPRVTLHLQDGIHAFASGKLRLENFNGQLEIKGNGSGVCTLGVASTTSLFFSHCTDILITDITFTGQVLIEYTSRIWFFTDVDLSLATLSVNDSNTTITDVTTLLSLTISDGSTVDTGVLTFDDYTSGAIIVSRGSVLNTTTITIDGISRGIPIFVGYGSKLIINGELIGIGAPAVTPIVDAINGSNVYIEGNVTLGSYNGISTIPVNQVTAEGSSVWNTALHGIPDVTLEGSAYLTDLTAESIGSLVDVDITGVVDDKILKWSSGKFILSDDTAGVHTHVKSDITDFSDGDYATAAQGTTADSALQPSDVDDVPVDAAITAPVSSNWAFDHDASTTAHGGPYNNYTHPSDGVDPGAALTGANVFSDIDVNAAGHVTGSATRALTAADIGAATTAQGALADSALQNLVSSGGQSFAIETTVTIDASTDNVFNGAGGTFGFSNIPVGLYTCTLLITDAVGTFPTTLWQSGTAPTLTANVDIITLQTPDQGTTWYGSYTLGHV